ncbi:MAG: hypothetical protein AAF958_12900 [Planctomycetota bacterium]
MFEIEKVFDRVADLKYPSDQPLAHLREAFKSEIYVTLGRCIETDMLATNSREEVVEYAAWIKLAGPGGTDWTHEAAKQAVREIIAGVSGMVAA